MSASKPDSAVLLRLTRCSGSSLYNPLLYLAGWEVVKERFPKKCHLKRELMNGRESNRVLSGGHGKAKGPACLQVHRFLNQWLFSHLNIPGAELGAGESIKELI